jgi:hypothetical protein
MYELNDGFQVVGVREKIHEMRLFNLVACGQQRYQVTRQRRGIA